MKQGEIKIGATVYGYLPAGDCEFGVTISKGTIKYSLYLHGKVDDWQHFGERLSNFPSKITDQTDFELNSFASSSYLLLRASCSGMKVVMTDDADEPHRCRLEFSIPAEVASLNKLGRLLSGWQVENGSEIVWEAQTS